MPKNKKLRSHETTQKANDACKQHVDEIYTDANSKVTGRVTFPCNDEKCCSELTQQMAEEFCWIFPEQEENSCVKEMSGVMFDNCLSGNSTSVKRAREEFLAALTNPVEGFGCKNKKCCQNKQNEICETLSMVTGSECMSSRNKSKYNEVLFNCYNSLQ